MIAKKWKRYWGEDQDRRISAGVKQLMPAAGVFFKGFICLFFVFCICTNVVAQKALKITRMRKVTFDTYNKVWSPWPTTWTTYQNGNNPVITITRLDDNGYTFKVDMVVNSQSFSFEVSYNGFDDKNNWTKYMDQNSDEIAIVGSTMSNLSQYGWPANTRVQIYFWIYSGNYGLELE